MIFKHCAVSFFFAYFLTSFGQGQEKGRKGGVQDSFRLPSRYCHGIQPLLKYATQALKDICCINVAFILREEPSNECTEMTHQKLVQKIKDCKYLYLNGIFAFFKVGQNFMSDIHQLKNAETWTANLVFAKGKQQGDRGVDQFIS